MNSNEMITSKNANHQDSERRTSQAYWESYYSRAKTDRRSIEKSSRHYDTHWKRLIESCARAPRSVMEIGCYPGRYLAYVSSRYNLEPYGIDFNSDRRAVAESMSAMGVKKYHYIQGDLFQMEDVGPFDIVYSMGFIEHFDNYEEVMDRHLQYLAPGGSLMIAVPNKRKLRWLYGLAFDRHNLNVHNLQCMQRKVFDKFAVRNELETISVEYVGGFAYAVHQPLCFLQKLLCRPLQHVIRKFNPFLASHPSHWYSSSIIAMYRKPLNASHAKSNEIRAKQISL